jgi:uncharacterized protein YbaR (Trm112 family)
VSDISRNYTIINMSLFCPTCGKEFFYDHTFNKHWKQYHEEDELLNRCSICSNTFKNRSMLKMHIKSYHTTKHCEECGKDMITASFSRHMKSHKPQDTLKCGKCEKIFKRKDNLKEHEKKCNEIKGRVEKLRGVFTCRQCLKTFDIESYLKQHIKKAHEAKEGMYFCKFCKKAYTTYNNLMRHMKKYHNQTTEAPDVIHTPDVGFIKLDEPPQSSYYPQQLPSN